MYNRPKLKEKEEVVVSIVKFLVLSLERAVLIQRQSHRYKTRYSTTSLQYYQQ